MFSQLRLLAALALVALVCQLAAADDGSKEERPWVEAEEKGLLSRAPVYEDLVYTDAKRSLDLRQFSEIRTKLLEVAHLVIVERKGYWKVATRAWDFVGLFKNFLKEAKELTKTDTSPLVKPRYGREMSQLVDKMLKTKNEDGRLGDQETYERVETLMNSIEKMVKKSPVGLYLDWNEFMIGNQSMPEYLAPVIDWMRNNGYKMMLKILGAVGGLFKTIGKRD